MSGSLRPTAIQEASPEGKAAEASSEAGERASARAFHAGSEAAEDGWVAREVAHFSAVKPRHLYYGLLGAQKAPIVFPGHLDIHDLAELAQ